MNLLLIEPDEIAPDRRVRLAGRRAQHLVRVLQVAPGRVLRAGVLGGGLGRAEVLAVSSGPSRGEGPGADAPTSPEGLTGPAEEERTREQARGRAERSPVGRTAPREVVDLRLDPCDELPPPPPADLVLALPRPKALRRILRLVAAVGVGRLDLVNAWRVERSYFASPVLEPEAIRRELVLGAEQGGVPRIPAVEVRRFFVPFVEELEREPAGSAEERRDRPEAPEADSGAGEPDGSRAAVGAGRSAGPRIVAHPGADAPLEEALKNHAVIPPILAVGPEGGWIEAELESFRDAGFRPATLGPWSLMTEHAVAVALGQLALLGRQPTGSAW